MPYKIDNFVCKKTLGTGASGKVKLAIDPNEQEFALKVFAKFNSDKDVEVIELLKREVEVYQQLKHPNLAGMMGFSESSVKIKNDGSEVPVAYLLLEFISKGEFF